MKRAGVTMRQAQLARAGKRLQVRAKIERNRGTISRLQLENRNLRVNLKAI